MSRLALYLLGPPRLELDGEPIQIGRRKAVALLAYLAVTGRSHRRDALATLLWPEYDQRRARADLRRTLSLLNRTLGEEWLTTDRETAGLNPDVDLWLDADQFRQCLAECETRSHPPQEACPDCLPPLTEAVALYRGDFLVGFTLRDSLAFDEWQFFQTEGLRDGLASALERLVRWHSAQGEAEYEQAIAYARRWLALDPLHEPAHRYLMELYARSERRGAALRQYRACLRTLEEELGVSPSAETTALYERIRAERARPVEVEVVAPPLPPTPLPAFLSAEEEPAVVERRVFVAREGELAQLSRYLDAALAGQGGVAFITGGAGRGKTALMEEFARRAQEAHSDLLVAIGSCNAYSGLGDPYLPFREVMGMLAGDVEARWAAGAIIRDHARRLWDVLPLAVRALLDHGAALIDIFLSGPALLSRAAAVALPRGGIQTADGPAWLGQLKEAVEREKAEPGDLAQSQLFEGYANVLGALAAQHPLLLLLDDLQWADNASISLLFHLGRGLGGNRILIVSAYRPEEVALGRNDERHPLEKVAAEFKRRFGDVWVDLTRADEIEGRRFVEVFLDSEPNRLGEDFRRALFQHTGGHPLFTVELLRAMQERGDLVQDEGGRWVEGPALDWETLPARVEGVIEERVGRLEEELRDILSVASVEGERFTAQVVARVGDIPEREVLRALSQELETRHRLVREGAEIQVAGAGRFLSRYQFAHALFQGYLYNGLGAGERRLLHGEIAEVLEELYGGQAEEITAGLAHHYAEAGEGEKAVEYSLRAGDQARVAYAHQEAVDHYRRALVFLKESGEHERAARTLMKLGLTHHNAFQFRQAGQAYDEGFTLWQRAGATPPAALPPAPHALRSWFFGRETLDPILVGSGSSYRIIPQLFSGLAELTPELEAVPDLARSWEMSEGGRKYVFHLREDARWSDGVPVTAGDFEYAWKRALDPASGASLANLLYDIRGARAFHQGEVSDPERVGVQALDEVTLLVELEAPTSYFLLLLAQSVACPVPRHVVETHGKAWAEVEKIVTNGPFRLEAWPQGGEMILARNPAYRGRFPGNLQRVELFPLMGPNPYDAEALYKADRLDIVFIPMAVSVPVMDRLRQRYADDFVSIPRFDTWYVGFDVSRPPFDDRRVRRAFILATDKERLADVILSGYRSPATGGFIPPGMPGHAPGIGLPYDPHQARQLLAEAGYPDGRGFPKVEWLTILLADNVLEYLRAQWRENLGIDIPWERVDATTFVERSVTAPTHVCVGNWFAECPDPDSFLRVSPVRPRTRWRNETYEQLIEEARRITDQGRRMDLYRQADRILIEEAPIMPFVYGRGLWLVKPWVSGFMGSPVGPPLWKRVIIEPH